MNGNWEVDKVYPLEWENRNQKEMLENEIIMLHTPMNGFSDLRLKFNFYSLERHVFTDFFFSIGYRVYFHLVEDYRRC